jgi:hypothetical protein
MQYRNPIMVIVLSIITFGIYSLVWFVTTKDQMNAKGAQIPTAWLLIIPFVNIWWYWKFSEGVELVTNKGMGTGVAFLLIYLLGTIGVAIIQNELNKVAT